LKIQYVDNTRTARARRYDWVLPLKFRSRGATEWLPGELVNISKTGLLFRSKIFLPLQAEFETRFNAHTLDDQVGAEIRCVCSVVRHAAPDTPFAVAGRILRSEMNGEVDYPWGRTVADLPVKKRKKAVKVSRGGRDMNSCRTN
jgi:hypothetical protein